MSRTLRGLLLAAAVGGSTLWAFMPLGVPTVAVPEIPSAVPLERPVLPPLDLAAFRAPLWVAPPAPPPPPKPEPPPPPLPPLKFQLLAIVTEAEVLKAVLYDPDSDRLLVVADGESLGTRQIERVRADAVDIRDERGIRTLSLADGAGGGGR